MDPLTLLLHLAGFVLPAAGLSLLLGLALWLGGPGARFGSGRLRQITRAVAWLMASGTAVLVGGLLMLGRDGRMLTYAVLVLVMGTVAWWFSRRPG